jgi:hypothetical protein
MSELTESVVIPQEMAFVGYSEAKQNIVMPRAAPSRVRNDAVDPLTARLLGIPPNSRAEAVTFNMFPDPWSILDENFPGQLKPVFWEMSTLRLTYVRAIDQQTQVITCYLTLTMFQTAHLYTLTSGARLHILSKTVSDGLLQDFDTGSLDTKCSYRHELKTYTKNFRPDFYDLASQPGAKHMLYISAGTWTTCHRTSTKEEVLLRPSEIALEPNEAILQGSPIISMQATFDRGIQRGDCLIEPGSTFVIHSNGAIDWDCWLSSGDHGDQWDGEFHIKDSAGKTLFITGNYHFNIGDKDNKHHWVDKRGPNDRLAAVLKDAHMVAFACRC